jgi:hypothetical protein
MESKVSITISAFLISLSAEREQQPQGSKGIKAQSLETPFQRGG